MNNPYSLQGKTILVTGASSGIGKATAIECAKLGARIVLTARDGERLKKTQDSLDGEGHICITADLTDEASLLNLASETPEIDGIVFCAGISILKQQQILVLLHFLQPGGRFQTVPVG